jgi:nitrate reductase gamma subunit
VARGFFEVLIGKFLPYVTVAILVLGLVYRLRRWQKAAVANMALYPQSSSNKGEMWRKILSEVVLFRSFRDEHKGLWARTWVFHVSLLLIILGHSRLFTDWPLRVALGLSEETVNAISMWSGGILGIVAMLCCFLLLVRRLSVQRVREISTGEDYLVMLLLLFILITGNVMRFVTHFHITDAQAYFQSLRW